MANLPAVTLCALTYCDYPELARRLLDSVRSHCSRGDYQMVVGANAVSPRTLELLQGRVRSGEIDRLIVSPTNLNKCPMMRQMFAAVQTEFVWWFDDDSYLTADGALHRWLEAARASPPATVQWGPQAWCDQSSAFTDLDDPLAFVRSAAWYRGLPPPSWRPGGKGEFNFSGLGLGDGRWFFILGSCFLIRAIALRAMDWPDRRLSFLGEDVFLGEAIRQQGWQLGDIGMRGVSVNTEVRRGKGLQTLRSPLELEPDSCVPQLQPAQPVRASPHSPRNPSCVSST